MYHSKLLHCNFLRISIIFEGFPPHSSFNSLFFKVKLYNTSYWSNHVRATRLVLHCVVFLAPEKKQDLGKIEVTDLFGCSFFKKWNAVYDYVEPRIYPISCRQLMSKYKVKCQHAFSQQFMFIRLSEKAEQSMWKNKVIIRFDIILTLRIWVDVALFINVSNFWTGNDLHFTSAHPNT